MRMFPTEAEEKQKNDERLVLFTAWTGQTVAPYWPLRTIVGLVSLCRRGLQLLSYIPWVGSVRLLD